MFLKNNFAFFWHNMQVLEAILETWYWNQFTVWLWSTIIVKHSVHNVVTTWRNIKIDEHWVGMTFGIYELITHLNLNYFGYDFQRQQVKLAVKEQGTSSAHEKINPNEGKRFFLLSFGAISQWNIVWNEEEWWLSWGNFAGSWYLFLIELGWIWIIS